MPRFNDADLTEPIAADTAKEDETLQNYMEKARLEHWVEVCKTLARERFQEQRQNEQQSEKDREDLLLAGLGGEESDRGDIEDEGASTDEGEGEEDRSNEYALACSSDGDEVLSQKDAWPA